MVQGGSIQKDRRYQTLRESCNEGLVLQRPVRS